MFSIDKRWWIGLKGVRIDPNQEPPTVPSGFQVLPKRWIVEHTIARLSYYSRLSKIHKRLSALSETFVPWQSCS
jgi:putative transposase